jgi:tetratricopeptide (TPR) repeat protein
VPDYTGLLLLKGEKGMKRATKFFPLAALIIGALISVLAPGASAQMGSVSGVILDVNEKPWAGLTVQAVSDQGQKQEAKTDDQGRYNIRSLRPGVYDVTITAFPPPNDKQPAYQISKLKVQNNEDAKADANFKQILAKQGAATQEAAKKQEEEKQKFQGMKEHFEKGIGFLNQAGQAKADLTKATADQRDAKKQEVKGFADQAVSELEAAKSAANEKDANLNLIWARLGDAYDTDGRTDDAINAYKQAIELKPSPAYYNNLGGIYGRAGKIPEAMEAYKKSAELDPPNAAQAYRNGGITLYNAGKMKEAVEPLKKATELDPKSAQAWYLLGASLVGSMDYKQVGNKLEVQVQPGTVEAYQKAVDLDPSGPYGQQAKQGLEALQQIAPGIDTKTKRKKS